MLKRMVFVLFLSFPALLFANNPVPVPSPVQAVRTKTPVQVDGVLSEDVWKSDGFTGFRQSDPEDGAPASEKTIVWVAFDQGNIYVAARLYDSSPEGIISLLGRRDAEVESDWFVFAVDPYYDKRSGFQFAVNPAGAIQDGTLFNDEGVDMTWDGIWEYASRLDDQGWTVELRIPFHQLHFRKKDSYTWGVNFFRTIKRKNERTVYSWIPKEESGYVSRFADLTGISDIHPRRLIEVLPYAVGRAEYSPAIQENPFRTGSEYVGNIGLDLKYALQTHLTLNASANPDFGQVEVDPAVINISDQETYYVEKRPFFVEGADIFRFGYGGANVRRNLGWSDPRFFYSRRIGRSPQGYVPVPGYVEYPDWTTILGAAKITGKMGDGWNLGVMTALTQREYALVDNEVDRLSYEVEPFSTYGVVRALKEIKGGFQGLGFIATGSWRDLRLDALQSRLPKSAFSFGLDGWTFLDRDRTWVITGWVGGTTVSGSQEAISRLQLSSLHYYQRPDVDYVDFNPDATTLNGWAGRIFINKQKGRFVFNTAIGVMSPGFHAVDLGYHTRGDVINGHVEVGYQSYHPGKVFRNWKVTFATLRSYDFGGIRTNENYILNTTAQLLNYWRGNLYLSYDPNRTSHYFTRGGPLAAYPWGASIQPSITSDTRQRVVFGFFGHYRDHPFGAYNYSFGVSIRWKPSSNFSISIAPEYSWRHSVGQYISQAVDPLKVETYGVRYILSNVIQETASMEIRLNWIFTPRLSLEAYLQPFLGAGDFFNYKELRAALTFDFDSFGEGISTISRDAGIYTVDPDGPGLSPPFTFRDPDFNLKSLRGTVVLRWEYRPGSTIYAVWTQNRADYSHPGNFDFNRDLSLMLRAPGDNIFLLKINYRFTL